MTRRLLSFSSALADPIAVRVIALCLERKLPQADVPVILQAESVECEAAVRRLKLSGLVEYDRKTKLLKVRKKVRKLLCALFEHVKLTGEKDTSLRADAKRAAQLHAAQQLAEEANVSG